MALRARVDTWTGWRNEPRLIDPANNASIIRDAPDGPPDAPERRWLPFSNTEHASERHNLVVKMSCDDGASWPMRMMVDSGPAAYSTIARLRDGTREGLRRPVRPGPAGVAVARSQRQVGII
jgi:sialidase-1